MADCEECGVELEEDEQPKCASCGVAICSNCCHEDKRDYCVPCGEDLVAEETASDDEDTPEEDEEDEDDDEEDGDGTW